MTTLHQHSQPTTRQADSAPSTSEVPHRTAGYALGVLRIVIGWTFLWAFLDKLLALGYSTGRSPDTGNVDHFGDAAWIHGGSPTAGFLGFAADGPFKSVYHNLAGTTFADWAFMLGLLAIGVAFTFGITTRLAAAAAAIMYLLMWSVVLPPENSPITDDHTIGLLVAIVLGLFGAGRYLGLGGWWERQPIVQRFSILK
jgi:thiosulfate dehydrogenase (quinone) large subunit